MANKIPFIIYAKITPDRGNGKRMEIQRSREHIAHLIYLDLSENFTTGNIALPGGGGEWGLAQDAYSLSNLVDIVAVKPQSGEHPDAVTINGFYNPDPSDPYPQITLLHANDTRTGPATGAPGWTAALEPTAASRTQVKALKTAIELAITSAPMEIIMIELNGIVYGQGGYHFPR